LLFGQIYLNVPSQIGNSLRQGHYHFQVCCAGLNKVEANSANASRMQPLELGIRHRGVYDSDPARSGTEALQGGKQAAIICSVSGGLDDYVADNSKTLLKQPIILYRRIARP
jgi:hypothetical protein